ncbi:MAG TPA: YopX family protein, partial [Bacteroidales bacterium]|nr:YopX family protein [Bacteroidales bacterium]
LEIAMREILFKAKRKSDGEWVEGHFYTDQKFIFGESCSDVAYIRDDIHDDHVVFENTLCQYTGIEDINGNKIFEGDIIDIWFYDEPESPQRLTVYNFNEIYGDFGDFTHWTINYALQSDYNCKIIGNIHDNLDI